MLATNRGIEQMHRLHVPVTCLLSSLSHCIVCIVGLSRQYIHLLGIALPMNQPEQSLGLDASHAIWQTIAHNLDRPNLASMHAVCRAFKKAVDDAVTVIAIPSGAIHRTLPGHERFPACKHYTFIGFA